MKRDMRGRLDRMENQQKLQLDSLAYMVKTARNAENKSQKRSYFDERKRDKYDDRLDELLSYKSDPIRRNSKRTNRTSEHNKFREIEQLKRTARSNNSEALRNVGKSIYEGKEFGNILKHRMNRRTIRPVREPEML